MSIRDLICAGAFVVMTVVTATAHADPDQATYELQERCATSAAQFATRNGYHPGFTEDARNTFVVNYSNHYNPHLNKCFMQTIALAINKSAPWIVSIVWAIWDISENRMVDGVSCEYKSTNLPNLAPKTHSTHAGEVAS